MPSGTKKYCEVCSQSGRQSRLKLYQINFNEAIQLCEDKSCSYPLSKSSSSCSIQQRDLSNVPPLKRKSSSNRSVKSAVSTPFGTPTVLSPVSFDTFKSPKLPSCNSELFVNSILSGNLVNGVGNTEPAKSEELDLEDLLNIGAFDEPVKPSKNNCQVNGFKEPLPLKPQNPPSQLTNGLLSDCNEFSKKYVTKSPKSLLRNPFEDIFDIDENTNVFQFDSEITATDSFTSVPNGIDFHQVTNGFSVSEDKSFSKFGRLLNDLAFEKTNNTVCSQDSESALDAEVRSIFESSHQLFEKNNLCSSLDKDKMMAPIKDEGTGESMENEPISIQGTVQSEVIQDVGETQHQVCTVANPEQQSSSAIVLQDGVQPGTSGLNDCDGENLVHYEPCEETANEEQVVYSTADTAVDEVPVHLTHTRVGELPPEEIMDYETNESCSDPQPATEEQCVTVDQDVTSQVESAAVSEDVNQVYAGSDGQQTDEVEGCAISAGYADQINPHLDSGQVAESIHTVSNEVGKNIQPAEISDSLIRDTNGNREAVSVPYPSNESMETDNHGTEATHSEVSETLVMQPSYNESVCLQEDVEESQVVSEGKQNISVETQQYDSIGMDQEIKHLQPEELDRVPRQNFEGEHDHSLQTEEPVGVESQEVEGGVASQEIGIDQGQTVEQFNEGQHEVVEHNIESSEVVRSDTPTQVPEYVMSGQANMAQQGVTLHEERTEPVETSLTSQDSSQIEEQQMQAVYEDSATAEGEVKEEDSQDNIHSSLDINTAGVEVTDGTEHEIVQNSNSATYSHTVQPREQIDGFVSIVEPSQITETSLQEAPVDNDIVRTAFLSTTAQDNVEVEGFSGHETVAELVTGDTNLVNSTEVGDVISYSDPHALVSQHGQIAFTSTESQITDSVTTATYQYSTVSEIAKTVDDAQPFQTIENVPILEQEVSEVVQNFDAVTVGEQNIPVDSIVNQSMVNMQQTDVITSNMMDQQHEGHVSMDTMEVDHSEGVLMSIPEQEGGDLLHSQIFTVPMTTSELPVTQTVDYAGINQIVSQSTDYSSQDDTLPDLPPIDESVTLSTPGGAHSTTQRIVLQAGQQLIDGTVYTTVPHTALSGMTVTTQNGVFTVASPSTTNQELVQTTDVSAVTQTPILISESSTSLQSQTALTQSEEQAPAPIPSVTAANQTTVKDAPIISTSLSQEQQAKIVAEIENDSGPVPLLDKHCLNLFVQWQNKDAMCWLDVVMIVLCNSPTIQKLLTNEDNTEQLKNSVLSTLLKAYYQAQHLMQKLTAKVHSDYKENLARNSSSADDLASGESKPGDTMVDQTPAGAPVSSGDADSAHNGASSVADSSAAEKTGQSVKPKTTTVVNKISLKSMQDYFRAMDILDAMREKIWNVLQPRLQCERGKNDSPLFALPLLVREPALLKEKFKIKFKYTFDCDQCSYHQEDDHSKLLPSFPEVPANFNMIEPCFVRNCFQCKAPGKRMKMTFSSIPDMLLLHFKEGLPHCRLNELCFTFGGETYTVTAVIQYKNNPDHFVAWIRNGTGDQWMECDDLKSTLCQFVTQEPAIPPKQIHIIMWEKNIQPNAARDLEETSACNILQSCLRVLQPDVLPGTSVVLPGREALAQGLKRKPELGSQNTVKYILSQSPGSKLPGIITLPAGTSTSGLQTMKIVSLPPASSASGLLANVAGLSSATSAGQIVQCAPVVQGNTGSFKPVILQSKNKPTILSSIVSSSSSPNILHQQQKLGTTTAATTSDVATPVTASMRLIRSGKKLLYLSADNQVVSNQSQLLSGKIITDSSTLQGNKVSGVKPQISVTGLHSTQMAPSVSKVPNLKYIQLDKSQLPEVAQSSVTTLPGQTVGGKAKTYVVGADGILQEVIKEAGVASPVKKNVQNIQAPLLTTPGTAPVHTGTPKIIVKKKNEKGEIVQTVLTDLDCKQNSELMKAIESLKNGDTTTGGAVIQQLIKGKEMSSAQSTVSSPLSQTTSQEPMKVISMKLNSPSVGQSGKTSIVQSSPGINYVKVGDNLIQLHTTQTLPSTNVIRGRGRGRGQARGGRKRKNDSRPVPIMSNTMQKSVDMTSVQSSPGISEPQCIVISPPGQTGQVKPTELTLLGNTLSKGSTVPQVVKVLSRSPGTPLLLSKTTLSSSSDQTVMSPSPVLSQQKSTPVHTVTTTQGKKITTLLASRLAQGGVLKKNILTIDPNQSMKASPVGSPEKSSPIRFVLPGSPGQPVSPTKIPGSSILKIQSSPKPMQTLPSQSTVVASPLQLPLSSSPQKNTTVKVVSSGQNLGSPQYSAIGQSQSNKPEQSSPSIGSPSSEPVIVSDSDGSKSPSKSPKYSPVISVQVPNADTAMIAKAIQTLVDKGVPIQQIQNQAFLSKLIATLKPKGTAVQTVTTPVARSLIQHNPKSLSGINTPQPVVSNTSMPETEVIKTMDSISVKETAAVTSPTKIVIGTSGASPLKQVKSIIQMKQEDGKVNKEEIPDESQVSPSLQTDASKGKTAILIKPGQSYLAAVKPYLKLGQSKESKLKGEFDQYKLKSDVLKDKIISDGGFTSIDMIKNKGKEKEKVVSTSAPVVTPIPVAPPKLDNILLVEEPVEDLVLPQEASKSPSETKLISPTRKTKDATEIVVVESSASSSKGKKANPLHVIADAAVSRLPVQESDGKSPSRSQALSGRGKGRGRGRPPKQTSVASQQRQEDVLETDEEKNSELEGKVGHKRSFMDAFNSPVSEKPAKEPKVDTVDHSIGESAVGSVAKDNLVEENIAVSQTKTPESLTKPRGRSRKQPVIPTPDSLLDDELKAASESSTIIPKSRGRGRKYSTEAEEEVRVTKGRGRPPSASPDARGRGRPLKAFTEAPTQESSFISQNKSVDAKTEVAVIPRGRGRPPKNSSTSPAVVKAQTPNEETEKSKSNNELVAGKEDTKEKANSDILVSDVKYVGKYKIHPIERPNTRRGGKTIGSPVTKVDPLETIKSPEQNSPSNPTKRRGRPPANPAKKAKTE